jgi:HEAT repeat protein
MKIKTVLIIAFVNVLATLSPAAVSFAANERFASGINGLQHKNASVRARAASDAVKYDREKGATAVIAALRKESNKEARLSMLGALGETGGRDAEDELGKYIGSDDREIRLQAAGSLAKCGNAGSLDVLQTTALNVGEARGARSFAARSLGGLKTDAATDVLEKLLTDRDPALRLQAVSSLANIGTKRALGLVAGRRNDADKNVKQLAENILKREKMR